MKTTQLLKKAQQRLYLLRVLGRNNITQRLLVSFYRASIESILTYCMCVWFNNCTVAQRKALQRVIKHRTEDRRLPSLFLTGRTSDTVPAVSEKSRTF